MITNKEQLEKTALHYGMLPFFANRIPGFSVEEMTAPGMLFGEGREDYGCWDWKGPVIREMNLAYGKFFRRKAGFVSLGLLPDFINYRRAAYPIEPDSTEAMLLDMIRRHEALTSTELRRMIFGEPQRKRRGDDTARMPVPVAERRQSLENPLQRLQMGGYVVIADFEYKHTSAGERYGFGVALYTVPEKLYGRSVISTDRTPAQSLAYLVKTISVRLPHIPVAQLYHLLR